MMLSISSNAVPITGTSKTTPPANAGAFIFPFVSLERNDLSYLVNKRFIVLCEEQSSLNQNMPLRMLVYITMLYRRMLKRRDFFLASRVPLPVPEFYEFYCGSKEQPLASTLRLSDSFPKDIPFAPPLELVVTRYNIGYNEDVTKRSSLLEYKPLRDYSFFVYDVRRRIEAGEVLKEAIQNSIEYCIEHDIMKKYLIENQKEVLDMYSLHWSEQASREAAKEDGRNEERNSGIRTLITTLKDLSISQPQVVEQLMKRYSLTRQDALAAVQANW